MTEPNITLTIQEGTPQPTVGDATALIVGELGLGAKATPGAITKISSLSEAISLLGQHSIAFRMWQQFNLTNRNVSEVSVLGLETVDGASIPTSFSSIKFAGNAATAGTITVSACSFTEADSITIPVLVGDDAVSIVDKLNNAAMNKSSLFYTTRVGANTDELEITAINNSVLTSTQDIKVGYTCTGVDATITPWNPSDSTFTGLPDAAEEWDFLLSGERFNYFIVPENYINAGLVQYNETSFNAENDIQDFAILTYGVDDVNGLVGKAAVRNSGTYYIAGARPVDLTYHIGNSLSVMPLDIICQFAGAICRRQKTNADCSDLIINPSSDKLGGLSLAAIPFHNTPFVGFPVYSLFEHFSRKEQETLNAGGVWTLTLNRGRTATVTGKVVSTKTVTGTGAPATDSFAMVTLNTYVQSSLAREYTFNKLDAVLSQSPLAAGLATRAEQYDRPKFIGLLVEIFNYLAAAGIYDTGDLGNYEDTIKRTTTVIPSGFRFEGSPLLIDQVRSIFGGLKLKKGV